MYFKSKVIIFKVENKKREWKEIIKRIVYSFIFCIFSFLTYFIWSIFISENWLEKHYPVNEKSIDLSNNNNNYGKRRSEIKKIRAKSITSDKINFTYFTSLQDFTGHNLILTNEMDLSDCIKLRYLWLTCKGNSINKIILPVNNEISRILIGNINLKVLDYQTLNPKTLKTLNLSNNNLKSNLFVFNHLINLEYLHINNNNFYGSFKSLRNLKKLKYISFHNNPIIPSFEWIENAEKVIVFLSDELKIKNKNLSLKNLNNLILKNWKLLISKIKNRDILTENEKSLNEIWQIILSDIETLNKFSLKEDEIINLKKETIEFYWNLIKDEIGNKLTKETFEYFFQDKKVN